jgi:hypothetical protein
MFRRRRVSIERKHLESTLPSAVKLMIRVVGRFTNNYVSRKKAFGESTFVDFKIKSSVCMAEGDWSTFFWSVGATRQPLQHVGNQSFAPPLGSGRGL